ncbi:MAG: hypothetical protein ACXW1M_07490 [Acidimicrobiia bacterium]
MTGRSSVGVVAIVTLALVSLAAGPAGSTGSRATTGTAASHRSAARASTAGGPPTVERVLILSLPGVGWSDLDDDQTPNLDALFRRSAIANLSTRAPTLPTDLAAGYATLGAGDKAVGASSPADGEAFGVDEQFSGGSADDAFTRRTGRAAGRGIVHLGIAAITTANRNSLWDAGLGALGDALARDGYSRAVVANADIDPAELLEPTLGSPRHREAALALVEPGGTLPAGRVDETLLQPAADSPFGTRLDPDRVLQAFDDVWSDRSVVLVEASDLARADAYAATQNASQRADSRARALRDTDELVGSLLEHVDPERDAVVVVGPAPRVTDRNALTVIAVSAAGFRGGLLQSPTTLRSGSVQLMDVGPSVLELVGIVRPDSMRGRPVEARGAGSLRDRRATLVDADAAASFRTEIRDPLTRGFVALQVLLTAGAIVVLVRRSRRGATALVVFALAILGLVTAVYLARVAPFHDLGLGAYFAFLAAVSLVLGIVFLLVGRRRDPIDSLVAGLGAIIGVLMIDAVTGSRLQFNSGFGYSPEVAGRFIGLGNISYAFLAASAVLLAGLVAHRVGGHAGAWSGISVLALAVVVDGAPFFGADVGGVLTMVPAFALTAAILLGREIRTRAVVALFAVTAVAISVAAVIDSLRPAAQRTHLGRLVEQIRAEGSSAFTTVVTRKLEMNLSTLTSSDWRPIVPVVLALVAYLAWSRGHHLARLLIRVPEMRASLVGLAVVMVLGYALNDQGIVIPAAMLAVLNPVLITLVVPQRNEASEEPSSELGSEGRPTSRGEPVSR